MKWIYNINKGLSHSIDPNLDLLFGMTRESIRNIFSYTPEFNQGRFEDEDCFRNLPGHQDQWIRPGFKNDLLSDIEVLQGCVVLDSIHIQTHTSLKVILAQLQLKGHLFQESDYSYVSYQSKIDIGDSNKNGGVEDLIYWILISQDLSYIDPI